MPKTATAPLPYPPKALLGLQAVLFIAYHGSKDRPIAGALIALRYRLSQRALEPVLQPLARLGVLTSQPGAHGGYYVADPTNVTVASVLDCFMNDITAEQLAFTHFAGFLASPLRKAQEALRQHLSTVTIADLCTSAENGGVPKELSAYVDYVI